MPTPYRTTEFGELRSLLHQQASRQNWERICAFMDQQGTDHQLAAAVDYANTLLEPWPIHYRLAPLAWTMSMCQNPDLLSWRLVRALELDTSLLTHIHATTLTPLLAPINALTIHGQTHHAIRLIQSLHDLPPLAITTLNIHQWGTSPARLTGYLARTDFPDLRALRIADSRQNHASITPLLMAPWLHQIERLELPNNLLQDATIQALLEHMPRLTHLNLSGNQLSLQGVRALLHSTRHPPLHTLLVHHNVYPSATQTEVLFRTPLNGLEPVVKKKH